MVNREAGPLRQHLQEEVNLQVLSRRVTPASGEVLQTKVVDCAASFATSVRSDGAETAARRLIAIGSSEINGINHL